MIGENVNLRQTLLLPVTLPRIVVEPASAPEKEYGYRDGQLLITATGRFNVALAANGAVATASSAHTCCGFSTTGAINRNNRGPWGNGEGWNDATPDSVPDWIEVDFAGNKTIDEIRVLACTTLTDGKIRRRNRRCSPYMVYLLSTCSTGTAAQIEL